MSMLASTSRARVPSLAPVLRRNAGFNAHSTPTEGKMEVIRASLYPKGGVAPTSASPIGARHTDYERRIRAAAPSAEAHETIERAWNLYRRDARSARAAAINAKYDAMYAACAELDALTRGPAEDGLGEVGEGVLPRAVYDRAMVRVAHANAAYAAAKQGIAQGKKKTTESRWLESRPEGIVPRGRGGTMGGRGRLTSDRTLATRLAIPDTPYDQAQFRMHRYPSYSYSTSPY
ncbi:hypothetical protein CspeluHIS016_0407120 [Cutaneotrichosporon spelunceum]|uniref:Uncharacterized protein n=1 Tax=Cutaneotrichosporon spelunceum TaxID=1672016 RepID=A0AAD3YD72_9TREE|nr:hypothetical protein CspeluHIS016_0407120 [Cutaneotrichosporon spelunceum]